MSEEWTIQEWREYQSTGRTPTRHHNRNTTTHAKHQLGAGKAIEEAPESKETVKGYRVQIHSFGPWEIDPDNIFAKWALDCIVESRILPDDRAKIVDRGVLYRHTKTGRGGEIKTVFYIEEFE